MESYFGISTEMTVESCTKFISQALHLFFEK